VLERLLADKLALVEQIRCLIRKVVESKVFENASENALKRPAA
jgi:hypothetical protein